MGDGARRYDLDWLRVLAVLVLVFFHSAAIFYRGELGEFYVQNDLSSSGLGWLIFFVYQWHMPLFFLLAGTASWFSLELRTLRQYVGERFSRLFIPFVFGTLVLVPPQVYYRVLSRNGDVGSFWQFYPDFFHGIRPQGNFEWGHLWFVVYLFVLSLVALPLLWYFRTEAGKCWCASVAGFTVQGLNIFLAAVPLVIIEGALRPKWFGFQNLYDDWANVSLYFVYFVYGFLLGADCRFEQAIARHYIIALMTAIFATLLLCGLQVTDILPERGYSGGYVGYQMLRGFNSWCWVMAILGLGQRYLSFNNGILKYASVAAYPVYLLHQTILVAIGFYVVQWQIGIFPKVLIISTASLSMTIAVYDLWIKRLNLTRFLFGLKPIE
ncbi:MAG: acyltransferase [Nostocaceae cyanobacterium]|nr:acyltransferase [Nostocaceae cyanobacterium]